jgi:hypothetical protein
MVITTMLPAEEKERLGTADDVSIFEQRFLPHCSSV